MSAFPYLMVVILLGLVLVRPFRKVLSKLEVYVMSKLLKTYEYKNFVVSPLRIEEFKLRTFASPSIPEVGVCWQVFEVQTYFYEWIQFNFDNKLIIFRFEGLEIDIPILSFADILDPPEDPKKKSTGPLTFIHKLILAIEIEILSLTIHMKFPDIESDVYLFTSRMLVNFELSNTDSQAIVAAVNFLEGHVRVSLQSEECVEYVGNEAHMRVAINIPTSMMTVEVNLMGKDTTTVHNQHFLQFFEHFNTSDDNAIEMKLALGLSPGGKMRFIRVNMEDMVVFMKDVRSPVRMVLAMDEVMVQLATVSVGDTSHPPPLPHSTSTSTPPPSSSSSSSTPVPPPSISRHVSNSDIFFDDDCSDNIIGDWVDESVSIDLEKTITVKMGAVRFLGWKDCGVRGISVVIRKKVVNSSNFDDHEDMTIDIEEVLFPWLDNLFLEWLLIAHNISDAIPDSRFGHFKSANMSATVQVIQMGLSPADSEVGNSVQFTFHELTVEKVQALGDDVSHFSMGITSLDITTSKPLDSLQRRFTVGFLGGQHSLVSDCILSVLYKAMSVSAHFSLGDEFQLRDVDILEVHIVEDMHMANQSSGLSPRIVPLLRIATVHIDADESGMIVHMDRMTGTVGFASILKCLVTYEMIICVQERVSDKMDLVKVAVGPLSPIVPACIDGESDAVNATSNGRQLAVDVALPTVDKPNEVIKTNTFKWDSMEVVLCLDAPYAISNQAEGSIYVTIIIRDLLYSTHGESDRIEFGNCNITSNGAQQYEFMSMGVFKMTSGTRERNDHSSIGSGRDVTAVMVRYLNP